MEVRAKNYHSLLVSSLLTMWIVSIPLLPVSIAEFIAGIHSMSGDNNIYYKTNITTYKFLNSFFLLVTSMISFISSIWMLISAGAIRSCKTNVKSTLCALILLTLSILSLIITCILFALQYPQFVSFTRNWYALSIATPIHQIICLVVLLTGWSFILKFYLLIRRGNAEALEIFYN